MHAYKTTIDRIDRDLSREGVSLSEYQVLFRLVRVENQRIRFRDLAASLIVSESRVSRMMQGMVSKGYVRKETDDVDRRATYAVLAPGGLAAYERTQPFFANALEKHFSEKVADGDVGDFIRLMGSLFTGEAAPEAEPFEPKAVASRPWFQTATRVPVELIGRFEVREVGESTLPRTGNEEVFTFEIVGGKGFIS